MAYELLKGKNIFIIEDDRSMREFLILNLENVGCIVSSVNNVDDAFDTFAKNEISFEIAIVDMYIPQSSDLKIDRIMRGEELSYMIKKNSPGTKIIGISLHFEKVLRTPLKDLFSAFISKDDLPLESHPIILFETIESILQSPLNKLPKIFIIHGKNEIKLLELNNYIQNDLKLGRPIILREKASSGKTIIEKFETEARDTDLVFALMTPDDSALLTDEVEIGRARQNVIFELGYFYASLKRCRGKIILLIENPLEIPSDLLGIVYINISRGIKAADNEIKNELRKLGWLIK
jgi:CheY-like chemotaxis protein